MRMQNWRAVLLLGLEPASFVLLYLMQLKVLAALSSRTILTPLLPPSPGLLFRQAYDSASV